MFVAVRVAGSGVDDVVLAVGSHVIEGVGVGFLYSEDVPSGAVVAVE